MPKIGKIKAEFLVDAHVGPEFRDEVFEHTGDKNLSIVSRYVEAVADATFAIRYSVDDDYKFSPAITGLSFVTHVDGIETDGKWLAKAKFQAGSRVFDFRRFFDCLNGVTRQSKLRFSNLQTHDSPITKEEIYRQSTLYQELGTIKVSVWREVGQKLNPPLPDASLVRLHDNDQRVHGKAVSKNAVSLVISMDKPVVVGGVTRENTERADEEPIATFIFKYRTRAGLQQLGIIERSPTPPPSPKVEDVDPESLTADQMKASFCQLQAKYKETKVQIKQEKREMTLKRLRENDEGTMEPDDEVEVVANSRKKRKIDVVDMVNED